MHILVLLRSGVSFGCFAIARVFLSGRFPTRFVQGQPKKTHTSTKKECLSSSRTFLTSSIRLEYCQLFNVLNCSTPRNQRRLDCPFLFVLSKTQTIWLLDFETTSITTVYEITIERVSFQNYNTRITVNNKKETENERKSVRPLNCFPCGM